jgi:hypothetical protein
MIQVLCAFSPKPRQVVAIKLSLPAGSMVVDALRMLHLKPEWLANSHHFATAIGWKSTVRFRLTQN